MMKQTATFLVATLILVFAGLPGRSLAQISVTPAFDYTQNFNSYLGNGAPSMPAGWTVAGNFALRGQGNGSNNAGGTWAYGTGTDWSLGYLGSGSSPSINYNVTFINNTGVTITQLIISYDYEQWRFAGGNTVGWTVTGQGALSATSLSALNTVSALSGPTGTGVTTPKSVTLTGLNISPGATFGIRWACADGSGNDNGNAIDNFHMVVPCTPNALTIDTMLCAGTSFSWNGNTYTTAQQLQDTFTNSSGCDSAVTINLGFHAPVVHTFADTACFGEVYNWGTQTPGATGTYTQVFPSYTGCDSTVTLHLFRYPQNTHSISDTICFGESINWGSQLNLNTSGPYTQTFTAAGGCDSNVTLHLFVRQQVIHSFADTICFGETYAWGALSPNATGTYTQVFISYTGCDSTVTLNLFEHPQIAYSFADTICSGETYTWGAQNPNATGSYTQVFPSNTGCDSTVTLNLFEHPQIAYSFADTICFGETYAWGAQSPNATGTYTQVFSSNTGCDSTVTLHFFKRPQITYTFADTACFEDTYTWGAQNPNATGTYTQVFSSYTGCDSTVTLHFFKRPQVTYTFADTACFEDTYTWGAQSPNATGTYTQVFSSYTGCDSTVTLHFFKRPQVTYTFSDTACFEDTYTWGAQSPNATGTYTQVFSSYTGCDSTVTLHFFKRPQVTYTFADTACFEDTYTWGAQSPNATGAYTQVFSSYTGCDSTVTLHFFKRPQVAYAFADTICSGQTYSWGLQSPAATGTYSQVFASYTGCDSTVTLNLFVRPPVMHAFSANICSGNTYVLGTQMLTTAGVYTEIFPSYTGCDSTVTLTLGVNPVITNAIAQSICYGASYSWGSQMLSATGTYNQAFPSSGTCDSVVTLNLTVLPQVLNSVSHSICYGTTYTFGPQILNASGTYTQVFPAINGCDSSVTLTLTVKPSITHNVHAFICPGETYSFGPQMLSASGTYTQLFTAADGCDSTVTLNLSVSPVAGSSTIDTAACGMVSFEGGPYFGTTVLHDTLFNIHGCDSVYRTINITVHNNTPAQLIVDTSGCGLVSFEGNIYYQNATLQHMYTSMYGCDSLERIVHVRVMEAHSDTTRASICRGAVYEFYGQTFTATGSYKVTIPNSRGCDYDFILLLDVNPLPVAAFEAPEAASRCIGDTVMLRTKGDYRYSWTDQFGTALGTGDRMGIYLHSGSNSFTITAADANGCSDSASITLTAQPCCDVWLPNAFSPNGDGLNDLFKPATGGHPAEYVLQIFNRWGQLVYKSFAISEGWDGTISGKPAATDTYYYRISGKCATGEAWNKKGALTLLR